MDIILMNQFIIRKVILLNLHIKEMVGLRATRKLLQIGLTTLLKKSTT